MELIDLSNVTNIQINTILNKYMIDSQIEDDGDVVVEESARFFIDIDVESKKMNIYTNIRLKERQLVPIDTLYTFLSRINIISDSVKYSVADDDVIHCNMSIPLYGHIDEVFFIRLIKSIQKELLSTQSISNDINKFISQTNKKD